MKTKSVISLSTGLKDTEKVTVALLVAVGSVETQDLLRRYADAGGRFMVCPICFHAKHLNEDSLLANAELGGTVPMWGWIGDEAVNTFSY